MNSNSNSRPVDFASAHMVDVAFCRAVCLPDALILPSLGVDDPMDLYASTSQERIMSRQLETIGNRRLSLRSHELFG